MNPQALFLDLVEQGSLVFGRLEGVLNEDNKLSGDTAGLREKTVLLHLGKLDRITSSGVRDWVQWVAGLEARANRLYFVQCSPAVVAQINMVRNFCGQGRVLSVQVPYFCVTCDREHRELVSVGSQPLAEPPTAVCETCGEPMEFDDLPETYFMFSQDHSARPVDESVLAAANRFAAVQLANKAAALKEISDTGMAPRSGSLSGVGPGSRPKEPARAADSDRDRRGR